MPVTIKKFGKKWCTAEAATGRKPSRKGRCFATRGQALAQMRAINASLKKRGKI